MQHARFNIRKRNYAWLEHHSKCTVKHGKCTWEQGPGLSRGRDNLTDRKRLYRSHTLHIMNLFNAVFNSERITTFAMNLVSMIPEIAMICTTKNTMGERLIHNNNDNDNNSL